MANKIEFTITADSSSFNRAFMESTRVLGDLNAQFNANYQAVRLTENSYEQATRRMGELSKLSGEMGNRYQMLSERLAYLKENHSDNSEEINRVTRQLTNAERQYNQYNNQLILTQENLIRSAHAFGIQLDGLEKSTDKIVNLRREMVELDLAQQDIAHSNTLFAQSQEMERATLGKNISYLKNMNLEQRELKHSQHSLANQIDVTNRQYEVATEMYGRNSDQARGLREELGRLKIEHQTVRTTLEQNYSTLDKVSGAMKHYGTKTQSIGRNLTRNISVPVASGVALVTKASADFETAMADVRKVYSEPFDELGNVQLTYRELSDEIRNLSKTIPVAHEELAHLVYTGGQLGIESKNVMSFAESMARLEVASNDLSATDAGEKLAQFANITKMNQGDFDNLSSTILRLGNNFSTTESAIVEMGTRLAGAGTLLGMTESDIMGVATASASLGIQAQRGGTAVSRVFQQMSLAVHSGTKSFQDFEMSVGETTMSVGAFMSEVGKGAEGISALAEATGATEMEIKGLAKLVEQSSNSFEIMSRVVGGTREEFANLVKENPAQAFDEFISGLARIEEEGGNVNEVLSSLGLTERNTLDTLSRLINGHELLSDALKMSGEAWEENTDLMEMSEGKWDNLSSKLELLKNQAKDVMIDVGEPFVDMFKGMLDSSEPLIGKMGELASSFANASPEVQGFWTKLAVGSIVIPPVIGLIGGLIKNVGHILELISKFRNLGIMKTVSSALPAITTGIAKFSSVGTMAGLALAGLGRLIPLFIGDIGRLGNKITDFTNQSSSDFKRTDRDIFDLMVSFDEWADGAYSKITEGYEQRKRLNEGVKGSLEDLQRYGNEISDETIQAIDKISQAQVDAKASIQSAIWGDGVTDETIENVRTHLETVHDVIVEGITQNETSLQEGLNELITSGVIDESRIEAFERMNEQILEQYEAQKQQVRDNNEEILEILREGQESEEGLTVEHLERIQELQNENAQIGMETYSQSQEELGILQSHFNNMREIEDEQSAQRAYEIAVEMKNDIIATAEEEYKERLAWAEQLRRDGGKEAEELAREVERSAKKMYEETVTNAENMCTEAYAEINEKFPKMSRVIDEETGKSQGFLQRMWGGIKDVIGAIKDYNSTPLKSKSASVTLTTNYRQSGVPPVGGYRGKIPSFAKGTSYARGGQALVGEYGAEMVRLPRGASVRTKNETLKDKRNERVKGNHPRIGTRNAGININMPNVTIREEADITKLGREIDKRTRRRIAF